jgi:hypothetical protein
MGASQYKSNLLRSDTVIRGYPTPDNLYAAYGSY